MKRYLQYVVLSCLFVILLAGIGDARKVTELTMWIMPNGTQPVPFLEEVLRDFHKNNRDIKVNVQALDWGSAYTKITTAAASGDVPDIVQLGSSWVSAISAMGAMEDFKDKAGEIGTPESFVPGVWAFTGIAGTGQVTAIPWIVDARVIYYRTDVFNKLGIKPSDIDTWEGLEAAFQKIRDANLEIEGVKVWPLGMPGKNDWNVIHNIAPWIWGGGGSFLTTDNRAAALDSDMAMEGISYYIGFVKKGYVPLECLEQNSSQVEAAFDKGSYAIIFSGPWKEKVLTTPPQQGGAMNTVAAKKFGILPYPRGPKGRYTFVGGSTLSIFKESKNKDAAWRVVKYLSAPKAQAQYAKLTGFLPANLEAFNDPYFSKDSNRKIYKDAVQYGRAYPAIPAWGRLEPVMRRRFGIMWDHLLATIQQK